MRLAVRRRVARSRSQWASDRVAPTPIELFTHPAVRVHPHAGSRRRGRACSRLMTPSSAVRASQLPPWCGLGVVSRSSSATTTRADVATFRCAGVPGSSRPSVAVSSYRVVAVSSPPQDDRAPPVSALEEDDAPDEPLACPGGARKESLATFPLPSLRQVARDVHGSPASGVRLGFRIPSAFRVRGYVPPARTEKERTGGGWPLFSAPWPEAAETSRARPHPFTLSVPQPYRPE